MWGGAFDTFADSVIAWVLYSKFANHNVYTGRRHLIVFWPKAPDFMIIYLMLLSDTENLLSVWENVLSVAIVT